MDLKALNTLEPNINNTIISQMTSKQQMFLIIFKTLMEISTWNSIA
jgi:hypothetical protein